MIEKWHIYVHDRYIGTVECTYEALKKQFPYSRVYRMGGGVDVWSI